MQVVFVLIKCRLGQTYGVAEVLADLEEASEVYSIAGPSDLLAKFYLEAGTDPGRFVTEVVQSIPNIRETNTIVTFNAFTDAGVRARSQHPPAAA